MFIAMNRFKVVPGAEADFEQVWTSRDTHLQGVPGFVTFHLLRGPQRDDHTLYSSHTIWHSYGDFEAWTQSEAFRAAHRNAGGNRPALSRPSGVRRFRGHPGNQRRPRSRVIAGHAALSSRLTAAVRHWTAAVAARRRGH